MRILLVLAAMGVAVYFFYSRDDGPVAITDPVYADIRIEMPIGSRQIDFVLFGKMASDEDCRLRANFIWEKMIQGCTACKMTVSDCKRNLEPRYQRLFSDVTINTAYLSFTRGDPGERDGRMVIWGVTTAEGNALCDQARQQFKSQYKGTVNCVVGAAE